MKIKKIYSIILVILVIVTFTLTIFSFNNELRRSTYYNLIGVYKLYKFFTIRGNILSRDFESASNKILDYLNTSQKVSKGKNKWLEDIVEITDLVSSKIFYQFEHNQMQKVYVEIDKISDDIYKNHIWLAKALKDDDIKKSIFHLEKALNLSKSNEEAYREIINIFYGKKRNDDLLSYYCSNFKNEFQGKTQNTNNNSFFDGHNLEFSIFLNDNYKDEFLKFISKLNEYKSYFFNFDEKKNINKINIKNNFIKGSKLYIKNLVLINLNNEKINIDIKDIYFTSYNSYFLELNDEELILLNNSGDDEIISLYLKNYNKDIVSVLVDFKIEKLLFTNTSICEFNNEN